MQVSTRPKYSAFYTESNRKLTHFITDRIFQGWKEQVKKVVNFRKNRNMKILKEIVGFWSEYSTQRMIRKSKVDQFKNYTDKAVLINVFDTMKSYLLEKANLKNRLRRFQKGLRIKTQKQFLVQWRINFRKSIIHSEQEAIADQM